MASWLGLFVGTAQSALAQTCPDPTDYSAHAPVEVLRWRPVDDLEPPVWPAPFDAEAEGSCGIAPEPSWCGENIAMVPASGEPVRGPLLLWLPGKNHAPEEEEHLLRTAAYAGYRTLGLAWDNSEYTRAEWCTVTQSGTTYLGGQCTDGCQFLTGEEMVTGVEHVPLGGASNPAPYPAAELRGLDARIALALQDLHTLEVNQGATTTPWEDYCDVVGGETQVLYEEMVIAGFSAGGQMASYLTYTRPTKGMFTVEAGADFCDFEPGLPATIGYPAEYDDTGVPPCGDPVDGCDPNDRFAALHEGGEVYAFLDDVAANLSQVSLQRRPAEWIARSRLQARRRRPSHSSMGHDTPSSWAEHRRRTWLAIAQSTLLDDAVDTDEYDVDPDLPSSLADPFPYNVLSTGHSVPSGCGAHGSMAGDDCLSDATGDDILDDVSTTDEYFLFPAYLEAFCRLEP